MCDTNILTYEQITKIQLTSDGYFLDSQRLPDMIRVEEFDFIDQFGDKQISEYLFYMMGVGFVITAKNTNMCSFIKLSTFLENEGINYKDNSRLEFEKQYEKEKIEDQKKIEYRNKLENYKRPKEKLTIGQTRKTLIEEGEYKQLKYKIVLYEDYYDTDQYFLEIENKNKLYNEPFGDIIELRKNQENILKKYNNMEETPGIFDLYIGSYANTNIVIVNDMKAYQDILKYNKKKYNTTYNIKEKLLELNFNWIAKKRSWELEVSSKEEKENLISYLIKNYQNEYDEKELKGINYCWECGNAFLNKCDVCN